MAFLQLNALSKRYGAVDAVVATDLAVEKGETSLNNLALS